MVSKGAVTAALVAVVGVGAAVAFLLTQKQQGTVASLQLTVSPTSVLVGEPLSATVTAMDASGNPVPGVNPILTADGTPEGAFPSTGTLGSSTLNVTLTTPGTYQLQAKLGSITSNIVPVTASTGGLLSVTVSASPVSAQVGQLVTFDAVSTGTPPLSYAWDFGDGTKGSGPTATHQYSGAGTYTATCIATDATGASGSGSVQVTVLAAPLTLSIGGPSNLQVGQSGSFLATATGGTPPYSFFWEFGDGKSATGFSVTHAYSAAGTFTVACIVTDAAGQTATHALAVSVTTVAQPSISVFPNLAVQPGYVLSWNASGFSPGSAASLFVLNGSGTRTDIPLSGTPATIHSDGTDYSQFTVGNYITVGTNYLVLTDAAGNRAQVPFEASA